MAGGELAGHEVPAVRIDHHARCAMVLFHPASFDHIDEARHRYPKSFATFWKEPTSAGGR